MCVYLLMDILYVSPSQNINNNLTSLSVFSNISPKKDNNNNNTNIMTLITSWRSLKVISFSLEKSGFLLLTKTFPLI